MLQFHSWGMQVALVGVGGACGTILRFAISRWWVIVSGVSAFPWPTFMANVLGSAVLGGISARVELPLTSSQATLLLFGSVGFCGGLTTFSTWIYELTVLGRSHLGMASLYLVSSLLAGFAAFLIAYGLSK